jgi:hypothetical protein
LLGPGNIKLIAAPPTSREPSGRNHGNGNGNGRGRNDYARREPAGAR